MKLEVLNAKHPTYDADRWLQLEALAEGGKKFKSQLGVFLPQNPVEPVDVYQQRRGQAHYRSYMGSIVNLYASWLFASSFSVKAYKRGTEEAVESVDKFYGAFQEDVGNETELSDFAQERFSSALTTQEAYWLVELPSNEGLEPTDADDFEKRGLGRATLKPIERSEVYDFEEDEQGQLKWVNIHTCYFERESWAHARDTVVETWRIYDREEVHTFQVKYSKSKAPKADEDIDPLGPSVKHGFKRVPLVRLKLPQLLCIGEQTFDTQLEHFRLENALSWLIRRTCYAQPLFKLEDGEKPPTMGAGYAIILGTEDEMGWTSPPTAPFDILQKNVDNKREEIYRIVHQMAQAVDNNAETVGRSADSKEIDAASTRIMLNAYGKLVSKAIEETYELMSEVRGDGSYEWSVEGFAGYDTATVGSLIAASKEARALGIPSKTLAKNICTKVAMAMLPEADQRVKDAIRKEIEAADFEVSSTPTGDAQDEALSAQAELNREKAKAEPIKAKASMISAKQPKAAPPSAGGKKPAAKK